MVSGHFHKANSCPEFGSMALMGPAGHAETIFCSRRSIFHGGGLGVNFNFGGWPELVFSAAGTVGRCCGGGVGRLI